MGVELSDEDFFAAVDAVLIGDRHATPDRGRAQFGRGNPSGIGALLDRGVRNQDSQTPWCFWSGSNKVRRGESGA